MTFSNHMLAGSIIGLTVVNPAVAVTVAFASHFAMDVIPHFGYAGQHGYAEVLKHRLSYIVGFGTVLTTLLIILLLVLHGEWFALVTGFIASFLDLVGVYNWFAYEKHQRAASGIVKTVHVNIHRRIQWCERPWGLIVEIIFIVLLSAWLLKLLSVIS